VVAECVGKASILGSPWPRGGGSAAP